ncbi:MAG: 16S rRNA (guanine(527)-N(7))-methyltransferase RsmG [Clostridia bacterium]|nr:16S rRNA (guanine(527)-N(7))-methyltransferase RsmG [Clostridia bacterium]
MSIAITEKDFFAQVTQIFKKNGLSSLLSMEKTEKLYQLTERLITENEKYNLTAITEPKRIILQHYADCATLCAHLPKGAKICDVGCGAGFPSLVLAILREDLSILAMDSTAKRVDYVRESAELLGLTSLRAVCARAEEAGKDPALRESFDFVTARAVAQMRVLCELCLPLVKVGGRMIAMKGKNARYELADAKKALSLLGAKESAVIDILLKDDAEEASHPLVILDKVTRTPAAYPRPYAQISKKPL